MAVERTEKLEASLFTTSKPDENLHCCVVAIHEKHAVSFRHGNHLKLKRDDKITLYNVMEPTVQHEAVVQTISKAFDLVSFELVNGKFENYPHASDSMFCGQSYKLLGVNPQRRPSWKDGTVSENHFGFWIGTSHGKRGDSGSAIFDTSGRFLGIAVSISEDAEHHPKTKIISSDTICGIIGVVGPDPFAIPATAH